MKWKKTCNVNLTGSQVFFLIGWYSVSFIWLLVLVSTGTWEVSELQHGSVSLKRSDRKHQHGKMIVFPFNTVHNHPQMPFPSKLAPLVTSVYLAVKWKKQLKKALSTEVINLHIYSSIHSTCIYCNEVRSKQWKKMSSTFILLPEAWL